MLFKRECGLFFETSNVEKAINYLEDGVEIEEVDERFVSMDYIG
jgi:hypothetical protein